MAYRRLPNTDNARIRALKKAIEKCRTLEGKEIINTDSLKLQSVLRNFETAQMNYQAALATQVEANKKLQDLIKSAKIYVSHFIQVLNLSVIRQEIKKTQKTLYKLDPDDNTVPDLNSNEALYTWGANVIKGEEDRLLQGGSPIYNPSIARVNVDYSKFKEAYISQKTFQTTTQRLLDNLSSQRDDVDNILRHVWNEVEAHFQYLPREEMLDKCRDFGVVYYIRKRNKHTHNEDY